MLVSLLLLLKMLSQLDHTPAGHINILSPRVVSVAVQLACAKIANYYR